MLGVISFLGRMGISAFFLLGGINKLLHWDEAREGYRELFVVVGENIPQLGELSFSYFGNIEVMLGVAVALQLLGSVMLFLGVQTRFGALLLLIYFLPITFLSYSVFWEEGVQFLSQIDTFWKNIAISGALLLLISHGKRAPSGGQ